MLDLLAQYIELSKKDEEPVLITKPPMSNAARREIRKQGLTFQMIKDAFYYDNKTKKLYRNFSDILAATPRKGYEENYINFNYGRHRASLIVWILHHMEYPKGKIFFIDGNEKNIDIDNLTTNKKDTK